MTKIKRPSNYSKNRPEVMNKNFIKALAKEGEGLHILYKGKWVAK